MTEKEEMDILDYIRNLPVELKIIIFQHFQSNMEFETLKNKIESIGKTLNDDPNSDQETRDNFIIDLIYEINENKFLNQSRKNMLYRIIFLKLTGFECQINNHHKWILVGNLRPKPSLTCQIVKYGIFLKGIYSCNGLFMAYLVKSKHDQWSTVNNIVKDVVKRFITQDYYLIPFDGLYLNYLDDLLNNTITPNIFESYQSSNVFVQREYLSVENKLKDIPGTLKLQQGLEVTKVSRGYLFKSRMLDWLI